MCAGGPELLGIMMSNNADAPPVSAPETRIFAGKPRKLNDLGGLAVGGVCARLNPVNASTASVAPAARNLRYMYSNTCWRYAALEERLTRGGCEIPSANS